MSEKMFYFIKDIIFDLYSIGPSGISKCSGLEMEVNYEQNPESETKSDPK